MLDLAMDATEVVQVGGGVGGGLGIFDEEGSPFVFPRVHAVADEAEGEVIGTLSLELGKEGGCLGGERISKIGEGGHGRTESSKGSHTKELLKEGRIGVLTDPDDYALAILQEVNTVSLNVILGEP